MIKLYHASPCPYGRKVLAVLLEKNLDYEISKMSFKSQDHHKPEYQKLNPNGELPTISDEGFVVYESGAICEYLEDEYPEPRLLPADSEGRARVRMVAGFCDFHLYPAFARIFKKKLLGGEPSTAEEINALSDALGRVERYIGSNKFVAGKDLSLADCAVLPVLASIEASDEVIPGFEKLSEYLARAKKRPVFKGASFELNTVW